MRVALLGPWTKAPLEGWLGTQSGRLPEGGRGIVVTMLAAALLEDGHQVEVLTLDDDITEDVTVDAGSLRVVGLPRRRGGRGRDAYRLERQRLRAALRAVDAEVLNPHWSYEYAIATSGHAAPRVVTVHDWAPRVLQYNPDPYRLVRLGMFVAALSPRPRVTAPSPQMVRRLRRVGLRRASLVPNGLDPQRVGPGPRRRGEGMHLLSVADGFGRLKNTGALIEAMPLLRRRHPGVRLTLVGPAHEHGGPAHEHAAARGLTDGIQFLGFQPHAEVLSLMRSADLLVHPAREESFGMVLIEAMAQGTPVIGGHTSGAVPWVLGDAGTLVDVGSPARIAGAVQSLLTDPERWAERSRAGYARVRSRFRMSAVAQGYLDAYRAACEDRRP